MVSASIPVPAPDQVAVPAQPIAKRARLWWLVHQWAGLKFSILLSFILMTGTLAVFATEIDWLTRPAMRVAPSSVQGEVDWAVIARNAAASHPDYLIGSIEAPEASAFAATVTVDKPDGSTAYLYAHPTTGTIQGEGHWVGAKRVLRNMHRHLNMPTWIGVPIVSSLAFLLLVSLVTSLVVYKKWWRGFFKPIRRKNPRTAWGDFHRLAGAWTLWFVALMVVTGAWYFLESTIAEAPHHPSPEQHEAYFKNDELADRLGAALAAARRADPELRIRRIQFPGDGDSAFKFEGQKSALLVRHRANAVWVDVETAEPILLADARALTAHQRISEAADPLHFGNFGGYLTKTIWFLFGLLLTGLSVSGVALYAMRLVKKDGSTLARTAMRGMGLWAVPAIALVGIGFYLLPTLFEVG